MEKNPCPSAIPGIKEGEVEKVFSKFDADGDGKISSSELGDVLNGLGYATSADEVTLLMSDLDTDGDGYIDVSEFKAFRWGGNDCKLLAEAFGVYDKDKDGKIEAGELHSVLWSMGEKCSVEDCGRMIGAFDVDGDGCINFEEFKKMMSGASASL